MTFINRLPAKSGAFDKANGTNPVLGEKSSLRSVHPLRLTYENLSLLVEGASKTAWCAMRPSGRPIYTLGLMEDVSSMQRDLAEWHATEAQGGASPVDWFVMKSDAPGIFNLGGDLGHFAERIAAGDIEALRHYGQLAVRAVHKNTTGFGLPMITLALVQGDALGGGFEHALSFDVLVAERSARLGLPEVLFNLFPGMGAYSFLSRKVGRTIAEELILSGRLRTGEELHAMGVVDVLAEDGQGEDAVREYITQRSRKHNAHLAVHRTRKVVNPVTLQELLEVVDVWAETAMTVTPLDLKIMTRLTKAQDRRLAAEGGADTTVTPRKSDGTPDGRVSVAI